MVNTWKPISDLVKSQYGIEVTNVKTMTTGVGGDTFLLEDSQNRFVFKLADSNEMNRPEAEPEICSFLLQKGIQVSDFIPNKAGEFVVKTSDGRCGHLQKFVSGRTFAMNSAPDWFMEQSAFLLGRIHSALCDYPVLPDGIGREFFCYMTKENAKQSYQHSLVRALEEKNIEVIRDLEFRIRLIENFPEMDFDLSRLTFRNTHGDYTVNQIICDAGEIKAVIDWTSACRHPVVWEVTRSFFYADVSCGNASFDEKKYREYVRRYESIQPLTAYDKENLLRLYFYQLAVCDYYGQYFAAGEEKKEEFLEQAVFATKVLMNLKEHVL